MPVSVVPLGLGRVRRTDASPHITINGTGFSAANNAVFVGGSVAPPITQGVTQITVDLPAPFSLDLFDVRSIFVPVVVVNNDTGETSDEAWIWIKADLDEAADERLDTSIPGPFEFTGSPENKIRFEARDMQRLSTLVEAITVDVQAGNVLAWDGTKIVEPAGLKGSGAGQILVVDVAEPSDLLWGFKLDAFLHFGGTISLPFVSGDLIAGGGALVAVPSFGPGVANWALDDGTLDLITLRNRTSGGSLLDR
ncbi:hypothetical protein LCGC14_2720080, partial [marine sediment metagenome]